MRVAGGYGGEFWMDLENGAGPEGVMLAPPGPGAPLPSAEIVRPVFGGPAREVPEGGAEILAFRGKK